MGTTSGIVAGAQATAGAAGAYSQAQAGRYNSKIHGMNARVADAQAADSLRRGEVAVQKHRKDVRKLRSAQRAAYAAQGVVVDQDVAAAVDDETLTLSAEDEKTIAMNATLEAWGHRVEAADSRAKGKMAKREGRNDALGTLLSTVGRFADTTNRAQPLKEDKTKAKRSAAPDGYDRATKNTGGR